MVGFILGLIKSFVTKELLIAIFKEVFLEAIVDELKEFVKDTNNDFDDKLVDSFEKYLDKK